jgi:hypothetical protein
MAAEQGGAPGAPSRATGREKREARRRKKGMGTLALFLLFGLGPALAVGWFYLQPEDDRRRVLDKIPDGAGGRAIKAGICVAILVGLARIALPAFHGAAATLHDAVTWMRTRKGAARILLFPVAFVLWLVWFLLQILVAVDAVMIVAACVATLVLVARILKPDLFDVGWLPEFLR